MTRKITIQPEAIKTIIHVARLEDDTSWFFGFATAFIVLDKTGVVVVVVVVDVIEVVFGVFVVVVELVDVVVVVEMVGVIVVVE